MTEHYGLPNGFLSTISPWTICSILLLNGLVQLLAEETETNYFNKFLEMRYAYVWCDQIFKR